MVSLIRESWILDSCYFLYISTDKLKKGYDLHIIGMASLTTEVMPFWETSSSSAVISKDNPFHKAECGDLIFSYRYFQTYIE